MNKIKDRIEDLDKTVAYYMDKVEKLEESQLEFDKEMKDYIRKCVWESIQSWVNSGHQYMITKINDKIITTELIRDEVRELKDKQLDLELTLERVNETLEKCKGVKMSRELKFRAWEETEAFNGEPFGFKYLDLYTDNENDFASFPTKNIEQYTSLKDKNGKEIYEGDIVRVSYGYNYEVRQFKSGAWRIGRDDLCVWADSSEVIGNIHEDPELIGGKE